MPHPLLINAMLSQEQFRQLRDRLPAAGHQLSVCGLAGSTPSVLVAALMKECPGRLIVVVAEDASQAETLAADLQVLLGSGSAGLFPQRETLPYEATEPHLEVSAQRVETLEALLAGRLPIIICPARALQELAETPLHLADLRVRIERGQEVSLQELVAKLQKLGFQQVPLVEGVGEFAVRGGIVDVFSFGAAEPARLELWGNEIVSVRRFHTLDQRSTAELHAVDLLPVDIKIAGENHSIAGDPLPRRSLLQLLPKDTLLIQVPADDGEQEFERAWTQLLRLHQAELKRGGKPEPPERILLAPADALNRMAGFGRIAINRDGPGDLRFQTRSAETVDRDMDTLSALLRAGAARGEDTLILCDNPGQVERLEEILGGSGGMPPRCSLGLGPLAEGFTLESGDPPFRVLMDHEIFRRARKLRRASRFRGAAALESVAQLQEGDYVVHLDHGIGRFRGLERINVGGKEIEALVLEYAGAEVLRVPVERLDLVQRWAAEHDNAKAPRVHKIGGRSWTTLRAKTEKAIEEMTGELLELYAGRQVARGHAFAPDSRWQKEMESGFLYEDTPDQRQTTTDVKRDMESVRPMDRLICGDVGYGKTEVAIRAAFKAAQDGKQVAMLAPTTILVEQHLQTFRERLTQYPIRIEALSRFRSAGEQERILTALADGQVDIVIGTHRLLQQDVQMRDLGLLIVDEEQRFGVRHKEKLKNLKRNIDVLAMTATPIPRTLHMSLAGIRDISTIHTPPRDRVPIITHVTPWLDEIVTDAIRRELDRGGQVFVVHNRIGTLASVSERVCRLVPDARVGVVHGQLPSGRLDSVMRRFLDGTIQILVTTAIVENGLDVPTANTLIVDRADQFGLAQLYQLRGRVGRSHQRAYCYLLAPESIDQEAEKRLRILEHYTDLGAGYAIALKDLELRGGGNILGGAQSGFVHAVGVETYTRLLEKTVQKLREGNGQESYPPTDVSVEGASYLPDSYVAESSQKLTLYGRISRMKSTEEVLLFKEELRDRFGPPPQEVERLLYAATMRILGTQLGIESILVRMNEARINFRDGVVPRLTQLQSALHDAQVHADVRRTAPLSLRLQRFGPTPLDDTLTAALRTLLGTTPDQRNTHAAPDGRSSDHQNAETLASRYSEN